MRTDNRKSNEMRTVSIELGVNRYAEGSALIKFGNTHVLCTASTEVNIPKWLQGSGKGWITAEYGMLPRSTHERMNREKAASSGRTMEISRLIARSLRSAVDLYDMADKQISIDCDVLQADGGTRVAAITGGFVALAQAMYYWHQKKEITTWPIKHLVSAISVGILQGEPMVDLTYSEDSSAETDANFVMTSTGHLVEVQGTAEEKPFSTEQLQTMLSLATASGKLLFAKQITALESIGIKNLMELP